MSEIITKIDYRNMQNYLEIYNQINNRIKGFYYCLDLVTNDYCVCMINDGDEFGYSYENDEYEYKY